MTQPLGWYIRRLSGMSPSEVRGRVEDTARQQLWRRRQVLPGAEPLAIPPVLGGQLRFDAILPVAAASLIPAPGSLEVLEAADEILHGNWQVLGVTRKDLQSPDWFVDPTSARRAPQYDYCFSIDHRSAAVTGNVKQVWELSRLQHVPLLSCAFALSGSEEYAEVAAAHLEKWWRENPFLSGVHWTSGIELGLRLLSFVWTRRLLDGWSGVSSLFEKNPLALNQIRWHQTYLDAFHSRGSSANNHVIAEAAGQLIAGLAFPWFPESRRWVCRSARLFEDELSKNTFTSGLNREMAFDYHGFVAELALAATVEAERAEEPLSDGTKERLCRILDGIAACVDEHHGAPRYGDSDDGRGLLLTSPARNRWQTLLAAGAGLFGAPSWWPPITPDAASSLLVGLAGRRYSPPADRPSVRPSLFADAGVGVLRTSKADGPEIWCRCDGGPHGFLSTGAHAHSDALSIEVRYDGTDVLADPGTYCYHGDEAWRSYFRSTLAHNTLEVGDRDQSSSGGPFLWTRHARSTILEFQSVDSCGVGYWSAEHDGYMVLDPPVLHRRSVRLISSLRRIEILDEVRTTGRHRFRLAYHLGPAIHIDLDSDSARLSWTSPDGRPSSATLQLPKSVVCTSFRGSVQPLLGWYSPAFGKKEPSTTLVMEGRCHNDICLATSLTFCS